VHAWWILLAVALLGPAPLCLCRRRLRRTACSGIAEIDRLDDRAFCLRVERLFWRLGYRVQHAGSDLILVRNGVKTAVRVRHGGSEQDVQEVAVWKARVGCDGVLVITSGRFSDQARRLARANRVQLWDRQDLIAALVSAANG
jgi:restriction system protein